MNVVWIPCVYRLSDRDSAIAFSDRIKSGVVGEQLWLQISEPTEKDMGKYAIEFSDGKGGLRRTVELSGQGETTSVLEDFSHSRSDCCTTAPSRLSYFFKEQCGF